MLGAAAGSGLASGTGRPLLMLPKQLNIAPPAIPKHVQNRCIRATRFEQSRRLVAPAARSAGAVVDEQPAPQPEDVSKEDRRKPRAKRDPKDFSDEVDEEGAPEIPMPGEYQQTLVRSFTLGGIGLHSGDYCTVRIRPAFAGDGRYFVHVPEGTNKGRFKIEEPIPVDIDAAGQPAPRELETEQAKTELFMQFITAQNAEGFDGTFQEWLHSIDALTYFEDSDFSAEDLEYEDESDEIVAKGEDEVIIPASMESAAMLQAVTLVLGSGDNPADTVAGAELLLAALEACGVENARIEVEGGYEIPVIDGSATSWATEIQFAGLRMAPLQDQPESGLVRFARAPRAPVMVVDGDAFISYVPFADVRLTAGLDGGLDAPVIGKQWVTWTPFEDMPFRFEIAPARRWAASPEELVKLHSMGMLRGGSEGCFIVAFGDRWYDMQMLRYSRDEPARHELMLNIGFMALLAEKGNSGLPLGHVVSYKATHELRMQFLEQMKESSDPEDWHAMYEVMPPDGQIEASVKRDLPPELRDQLTGLGVFDGDTPNLEAAVAKLREQGQDELANALARGVIPIFNDTPPDLTAEGVEIIPGTEGEHDYEQGEAGDFEEGGEGEYEESEEDEYEEGDEGEYEEGDEDGEGGADEGEDRKTAGPQA